jgi:hypothetical protein
MTLRAALAVLVTGSVTALGAVLHAQTPADAVPTPIEQALIERACSMPSAIAAGADKHDECLHARLAAVRADFGNNLGRLSAAERRKIDSACGQIGTGNQGRDGYLDCLARQLAIVRNRWSTTRTAAPQADMTAAAPLLDEPAVTAASSNSDPAPSASRVVPFAAVVTALSASIVVPLLIRKRRARRVCHACQARMDQAGDLCVSCRREAAEAQRRAAAERLERQAAQENERLQRERDDEARRQLALEAEEARVQQEALARQNDEARRAQEEERRAQIEQAERQRRAATDVTNAAFDPYAILGVPHDASPDAIRLAHEEARSKYDFDQVADLGAEIQQHYRTKAQAVDRAFQMLAASHFPIPSNPPTSSVDLPNR